jgi:hypothetical protein
MFPAVLGLITFALFAVSSGCLLNINIARVIVGSFFASSSAVFFVAVFLHWTVHTSATDERLLPVLLATLFGIVAFVTYMA